MSAENLFPLPPETSPIIYAYTLPESPKHSGCVKIGYTTQDPAERIRQQTQTAGLRAKILFTVPATRNDGSSFRDTDVHRVLEASNFHRMTDGREWFRCSADDARKAVEAVRNREGHIIARDKDFPMRPEQEKAVSDTAEYFSVKTNPPRFLWNAKMRFGKTFAAYQLCKRMGLKKILVVTFKPAAEDAWREDILSHRDFEGWQFISNHTAEDKGFRIDDEFNFADKGKPVVVFGSFQDLLGTNKAGGVKAKNEFIHQTRWDIAVFDEYHFGAWREGAQGLFRNEEESADPEAVSEDDENFSGDENFAGDDILPIDAKYRLYLSGTPFRALNSGEFIEDQIYSWTYSDEQREKMTWPGENNPYKSMPRMVMMTYKIPESIRNIAEQGEFNEFDLSTFFQAEDDKFKHEDYVRKWLFLIRGSYVPSEEEGLRLGGEKMRLPYSDSRLVKILRHTVWFLPDVASCRAMKELLTEDAFFRDYEIVLCAGDSCGNGAEALDPVREAMTECPKDTRTITLTCGKLLAGVTVKPWTGIFMLRNLKSPETYFQAAFRVQSPWTEIDDDGKEVVLKEECYVFDFAINRALKQIADYSGRLNIADSDPERKTEEFMQFLPVLAFDDGGMTELDARAVMEFAFSGITGVLLARRWKSPLLVNLNNETLSRLMNDEKAMEAVKKITAFRNIKQDIETIINRTRNINDMKNKGDESNKPKISEEEEKRRKEIKEIRKKLMKFLTRIPLFMYLTDEREKTMLDIVRDISPQLFKEVTGITIPEFERIYDLELFDKARIDTAIYDFKRYEDASLSYTGLETATPDNIGGFESTITREEFYGKR